MHGKIQVTKELNASKIQGLNFSGVELSVQVNRMWQIFRSTETEDNGGKIQAKNC